MFNRLVEKFRSLVRNEEGATAVEYGLIVGLIAVVLVVAVGLLTGALQGMFEGIAGLLENNTPADPTP